MKKIAELLGFDRKTVKKYINPNCTPYIRKTVQNKSILDNYKEYINDLFIKELLRDIDAVKNSIIYEYNNGLAEGSVNKLKVIKRIMYGRNKFELLINKIIYLENIKKIN